MPAPGEMEKPALIHRPLIGQTFDGWEMIFGDGLRVLVTRVDINASVVDDKTQLAVFINTEEMGERDHEPDPAGGLKPLMEVLLNDAVLYDEEP